MNKSLTVVTDHFPSPGRPIYVFVQQLVFALADLGVDVKVVAPQSLTHALLRGEMILPKQSEQRTADGNAVSVYRPYSLSFGTGHRRLTRMASKFNSRRLNAVLDRIGPDILYGHFWYNANSVREYALKHRIPLFVACGEGDNALEDLAESLSPEQKKRLKNAVKGVISVSSENRRKSVASGLADEEDIIVLPNCVDERQFHPADASARRRELGIGEDDFVIAYTGAFIRRKGSSVLSDAVRKLNDPHVKLIFMGAPLKGDDCTPDCPGIVYMGSTEHGEIPALLNSADLFVLPTLKEGCCNAIVEALACGVPVISSDRVFNDDILNEDNSTRVNPESPEDVADAIAVMMSDRQLYQHKKRYAADHSADYSITDRAAKIWQFVCDRV